MLRIPIFFAGLCGLFLLSSCEKKETRPEPIKQVRSITHDTGVELREYDAENRITRVTEGNGNYLSYSYGDGEIVLTAVNANGQSYTNKLVLNEAGYVTEWYFPTGDLYASYEYDADGYIAQENFYSNGSVYTLNKYNYSRGNLVSKISMNTSGTVWATTTYEYFDDENSLSNAHLGVTHLGKSNKNLQKLMLRSTTAGSVTRLESTFNLDEAGLVRSEYQVQNNSGIESLTILRYDYE